MIKFSFGGALNLLSKLNLLQFESVQESVVMLSMWMAICLGWEDSELHRLGTLYHHPRRLSVPHSTPPQYQVKYEVLGGFIKKREAWVQVGWSVGMNWILGPWLMTGLAWATLPDVAGYRNGVIIVGIARCGGVDDLYEGILMAEESHHGVWQSLDSETRKLKSHDLVVSGTLVGCCIISSDPWEWNRLKRA